MFIENKNNSNKADRESNLTQKFETVTHAKRLDIPIGMKHFIRMIMMTNLAIHMIVVPLQTASPHLMKFLTKSHRVIYRKSKKLQRKGMKQKGRTKMLSLRKRKKNNKCNIQSIKEKRGNLDIQKNRYYHQPKAPAERIKSTFSSAVTRKRKKLSFLETEF